MADADKVVSVFLYVLVILYVLSDGDRTAIRAAVEKTRFATRSLQNRDLQLDRFMQYTIATVPR